MKHQYASFGRRLGAALVDSVVGIVLGLMIGLMTPSVEMSQVFGFVAGILYYVGFTGRVGQTPGKMLLKIKVIKADGKGEALQSYGWLLLRETVGKFLSGIVILLGYFWMIWDDKKQTWHDKLGKTVVINVN